MVFFTQTVTMFSSIYFLSIFTSLLLHGYAWDPYALTALSETISQDSCEFYKILEFFQPCGATGYVQSFALKYCEDYLYQQDTFKEQRWQNGVRTCLQNALMANLRANKNPTCQQIRQWGFDSHFGCYMRPIPNAPEVNYCRLPATDLAKIAYIARGEIFEKEVMGQFAQMVRACAGQYLQDVKQDTANYLKKLMSEIGWKW